MKLNKLYLMLMASAFFPALVAAQDNAPDGAQDGAQDVATGLPGPGVLSLVVIGIVAAVAIARRRS
jgi:hypothetical protein